MITKNIVKQPKSVTQVEITVPWADLASKWDATAQKLALEVEIPGFRKGTAPMDMVEPKIASQIQQELLKEAMPQNLVEALKGTDIVPIDYPQYQVVSFAKGTDLKFNARVTERPKVVVGTYKTIKVGRPAAKPVTDEEVEKIIGDLFKRWQARQPLPSQPAANPAQPAQGASGSMSFNQATPAAPNLTTATAPDDNFAKAVGGENLIDLKAKIRQDLESESKYENELDYEEAILQEVEKMTTVEVPEVLIQDELNRMLVSLQRRISDAGMLFDDYLKSQNKTLESLKDEWRAQAEKNVRMELGLSEIARQEGVQISDVELQAEIDKISDQRVKQQFTQEEPKMHLRHALRQTKTLNLLKTIVG
jgi:FKBP-type peptidyl-prolyl cis-trans isomerase (trigger factor)